MIRRKQHAEIAKVIRPHVIFERETHWVDLRELVSHIADVLKKDNPTFDRSKFMREAGYYDE